MKSTGASKIGLVRKANEDRFYIGKQFYIVADGMGGYKGGEIASSIAIDDISQILSKVKTCDEEVLSDAIRTANQEILSKVNTEQNLKGMGTTVVVAYLFDGHLFWANVGDSRLYIYRDNELMQISKDHSLFQTLVDSGKISPTERMTYPKKNYLTRAVGVMEILPIDTGKVPIKKNDKIILCSDGLSSYISDEQMAQIIADETSEEKIVEKLISTVYEVGAKDNVTVIVSTVSEDI